MNWLIASDIHGSNYYCDKLLSAFNREKSDRIILLGDILYHGPRNDLPKDYNPKSVIAKLNNYKDVICSVRGNCEADVDQMVLEFPVLADYILIPIGKRTIFATHGHIYNETKLPPLSKGDILLHGHTHVSTLAVYDDYVYANPGSVSIPKENTPNGYILLTDEALIWKTLDGEEYNKYLLK